MLGRSSQDEPAWDGFRWQSQEGRRVGLVGPRTCKALILNAVTDSCLMDRTRMMEKMEFKAGDMVVYPTHGVGRVEGVELQEVAGNRLELVVISFPRDRMTLRVPLTKAATSGLRKLSTQKVMKDALMRLRGRARVKRAMWSRRAQEYEAKINSGDPISIAEVVRDLHRKVDQPDQSFSERQIYEAALDRLACELAAVEKIDREKAAERLEELLMAA